MYPLGQAPTEGVTTLSDAAEYLRDRWEDFLGLSPRIIDLQHRAALARQGHVAQGETAKADAARALILELGRLNVIHGKIVDHFAELAPYVGLGAVAVPVFLAAAFSTAAIAVLWFFRKMDIQEQALDLLEAGVLTEAGFLEMNEGLGASPLRETMGLAKLALWAFFAWVGLQAFGVFRGPRSNPPLVIFGNPPDDFLSWDVVSMTYAHADDGQIYEHEFQGEVTAELLPDGGVLVSHPTRSLWRDF